MSLSIQNANGVHIATLMGSLDNASGSDLVTTIKNSVEKGSRIILDCTQVPSMDVPGFRHLLALNRWCAMNNGQMVLAGMVPEAWALVVENHCEDSFEASPSVEVAMQTLGASTIGGMPLGVGAFSPSAPAKHNQPEVIPTLPGPIAAATSPASLDGSPESEIFSAKGAKSGWDETVLEPTPQPSWAPPPPSQGWEEPGKTATPTPPPQPNKTKGGSKTAIRLILATAAAAVVGWFLYSGSQKPPEIIIEPTMVEVVQGREITDVRVSIMNGELDRDATKLPEGLSLDSGVEFDGGWDYFVTGAPKQAGEHEVTIHAFRGEITAVPSMLRVIVKEVTKLEWVFQSQMLPLDEGKAIPSTSYTKIVNGANSLKIRWNGDAASGLEVEAIPTAAGSWRLTGTPAKAGKFKGEFVAVKKDGNEETRPFTLEVKARKTAQVASAPTAENSSPTAADKTQPQQTAVIAQEEPKKPDMASTALPAAEVASTTPSPAPAEAEKTLATPPQDATPKPEPSKNALMASNLPSDPAPPLPDEPPAPLPRQETKDEHLDVIKGSLTLQNDLEQASYEKRIVDDRMRTFLMERIEKANSHFSDADKEMLREIVTRLKNAARIATVSFDNGQTRLKPQQVDELKQALATPDVAELLANPDCQVLVVGYASNTGSHAVNIRFSQQRAKAVNEVLKAVLGRGADLCGDYGPTDLLSPDDEAGNRVVEVYAGIIQITKVEQILADGFKNDFNKRHGGR